MACVRKRRKKWSKKKEEFLRGNYKRLSIDELAAECGMPPNYVRNKITELDMR